jgi:hypothetical protein
MVVKSKNRVLDVVIILVILGITIIYGGATNNFDYETFKWSYEGLINTNFEPGYKLIETLFANLNVSYNFFRLCIAVISITLVSISVNKFIEKKYKLLFYISFFFVTVPFFAYSLRSAIAFSIIMYAFTKLIVGKKMDKFLYFILIIIAMQFHISTVIFLLFLLVPKYKSKNVMSSYIFLYMFFSAILLMTISDSILLFFINVIFDLVLIPLGVSESKLDYTLIEVRFGFILFSISQLGFVTVLYFVKTRMKIDIERTDSIGILKIKLHHFVLYSSYLMFLVIPLMRLNTEYSRLIRGISPLYYLAIFSSLSLLSNKSRKTTIIITTIVTIVNLLIYVFPYLNETFYPLFRDNWIF